MRTLPRTVGLVALLALTAVLVLGAVTGATASTLTTKAVKKIAAKVVAKKAKGLTVAHAATATTATTASSSASVTVRSYTLPVVTTPSASRTYTFTGLPAGTYAATYDVVAQMPGGSAIDCGFGDGSIGHSFDGTTVGSVQVTGTAVVDVGAGGLTMNCQGSNFTLLGPDPSTVTFVPVSVTRIVAAGG